MSKYEYVVIEVKLGEHPTFQEQLTGRGRDGWRLVAYHHREGPDVSQGPSLVSPGYDIAIMEREVRE